MKLKICGLKYPSNVFEITQLDVDYIGFIFYKPSPRYFDGQMSFDEIRQIPRHIKKTGVFVNEPNYSIYDKIAHYDLEVVQLHGKETAEECLKLKPYVKVIKAFGINEHFDLSQLEAYENAVDLFLFDTASQDHGGTGKTFDHSLINNYKLSRRFFLSGGISLENISQIKKFKHPQLIGYDINSKFENEAGLKDTKKIKEFIKQINHENNTN